ncbi:unnamed protein product [Calypogeia fissa]
MSSFIFTTSLRVRLGLPHPGLLEQPSYVCGHALDPVGTLILRCSHGSERAATHDDLRDVLAAIARDVGYHVSLEQTHVLPVIDGIPDRRRVDIVFSRAGMRALADVVVADPTRASMVSSTAHISGHAASHTARLKEEAYATRHPGDLFYPFAVEVFGALHPALDRFLWASAALCVERRLYPPVSVALQRAQAFTIERRAEGVGFRASRHVSLLDPPLTFTADLIGSLPFLGSLPGSLGFFALVPVWFQYFKLCKQIVGLATHTICKTG